MVEELKKQEFKIMGVITNNFIIPKYDNISIEKLIPYRLEETKKITLLNVNDTNKLSTKNISKLQLACSINEKTILLYDFSKGLNNKELNYYKLLFHKMTNKYGKRIILL